MIDLKFRSLFGMQVIQSHHVPKKKVPVTPSTDDMREMVEKLCAHGVAAPQFRLVDQVLISNGKVFAHPNMIAGIINYSA